MRDNIKTPLAIFSAEREGLTERQNAERTDELRAYLKGQGIPYNEAQGCWDGTEETSFIIHGRELSEGLERLLFSVYEQEAVLTTDINGAAFLHYARAGKREPIGNFTEVPSSVGLDAYTRYGSRYYTVIPFNEE